MAKGDPLQSPYIWEAGDYLGRVIRITVDFNNSNRNIQDVTVFRDSQCLYTKIFVGTGATGPNDTIRQFTVPAGTTALTQGQINVLRDNGAGTIEGFLSFQITAGT